MFLVLILPKNGISRILDLEIGPPMFGASQLYTLKLNQTFFSLLPGIVHNGVEPVSNCEDCAVSELTSNRLLDELISFQVHRGRGFIKNQYFSFAEKCSRQTYQLPLTHAKIGNKKNIELC